MKTGLFIFRNPSLARASAQALLVLLFCLAFWLNGWSARRPAQIQDDALQMMDMAYNLAHHGEFSDSECAPGAECKRELSMYRGPGYPLFLSLSILLHPDLYAASQTELRDSARLDPMRNDALLLLFATAALSAAAVWLVTKRFWVSYGAALAVGFNPVLVDYQNEFYTEGFLAFLLTLAGLLLMLSFQRRSLIYAVLTGGMLGALALSNPIFSLSVFVIPVLYIPLSFYAIGFRRALTGAACIFAGFYLLVGPWQIRNYVHFGHASVSLRGGPQLLMRAHKDLMTWDEYKAAVRLWSNCQCLRKPLEPIAENPRLERLDRGRQTSFYRVARTRWVELRRANGGAIPGDKLTMREALDIIISHPFRHLFVSFLTAYRGMGVQRCGLDFILFFSLLAVSGYSLCRRMPAVVGLLLPALYSFAFYSLMTYYIPRYSIPLLPALWISLFLLLERLSAGADNRQCLSPREGSAPNQ